MVNRQGFIVDRGLPAVCAAVSPGLFDPGPPEPLCLGRSKCIHGINVVLWALKERLKTSVCHRITVTTPERMLGKAISISFSALLI